MDGWVAEQDPLAVLSQQRDAPVRNDVKEMAR